MMPVSSTPVFSVPAAAGSERIPVLDSLRGAAILMVFAHHAFFWSGIRTDWWLARAVSLLSRPGWLGVDLFFVLSGFLITGRLLDRRHAAARGYYRWFYTRRALRILPLYYTMLAIVGAAMWWAGETSLSFLAGSVLFMPNIAMLAGMWTTGPLAVLWSLGIEEQVYFIWPFLVRSLTRRRLAWFFVGLGLIEPLLRYLTFATSHGAMREGISMVTWLRLDGFAWGGLLAILVRDVRDRTSWRLAALGIGSIVTALGGAGIAASAGYLSQKTGLGNAVQLACADLLFAGVLAVALWKWPGPSAPNGLVWHSVLSYFGRVSYCLYLVHLFAFWCFDKIAAVRAPWSVGPAVVRAIIVLAVSTAIAELSWRYLEAPLLAPKGTGRWTADPPLRAAPVA